MSLPSYVNGTSLDSLQYETISEALDRAADTWPERTAVVSCNQNIQISWAELRDKATVIAANFVARGLKPGDRVGIWSPNCLEWVLTQFATASAGLVLVNINPAFRTHELEYALQKVGCKALILAERFKDSDYVGLLSTIAPELTSSKVGKLACKRLPDLKHVIVISASPHAGSELFSTLQSPANIKYVEQLRNLQRSLTPDDAINIQFTSGTTGAPKGATLSHFNILNNGRFVGEAMALGPDDRVCIPVPLYHCFGMVMGVLACVVHGSAIILPSEVFDANKTVEVIDREMCTAIYGVPTMFIAMLACESFASTNFGSLRTGIMAGAPCPLDVMRRVVDDMGASQITIAYGMTETSPVSFQSSVDDPLEKRVSTVGRIHPHVQVKIVDERGAVVPRGEQGELCTRGYNVMLGYWNDERRTDDAINKSGWMKTGDLATMDDEGYVNITGRLKDMVIRGGENLYPKEIEEFLFTNPKVQDVQVVGVPDQKYGEELCAWIIPRPGEIIGTDEIKSFCKDKIAHHKIPKYVRCVEDFPMTVTGKVQKFKIREAMSEELNLKSAQTA
jgi:fatty-acyl-CoA synthase